MGRIVPVITGVSPTGMNFGPGKVVVCDRHLRAPLQPVTTMDLDHGYGRGKCPFCQDGPLHGQYHKLRSKKRWWFRLEMLAAQMIADRDPIDLTWDSKEGLGKDSVDLLVEHGRDGAFKVQDEILENSIEWVDESYFAALQNIIDELDLDMDQDELREWVDVPVEIDLKRLARRTSAYLAIRLEVEHIAYWQDYDDVADELEFFCINPADLREHFPEVEWPDIKAGPPLISVDGLVEGWINFNYPGYWYVMLEAENTLELLIDGEIRDKMTLKKGANVILHDYVNGASSIDTETLRDIELEDFAISNDGSSYYGIQSTCGLIDQAWNGVLE